MIPVLLAEKPLQDQILGDRQAVPAHGSKEGLNVPRALVSRLPGKPAGTVEKNVRPQGTIAHLAGLERSDVGDERMRVLVCLSQAEGGRDRGPLQDLIEVHALVADARKQKGAVEAFRGRLIKAPRAGLHQVHRIGKESRQLTELVLSEECTARLEDGLGRERGGRHSGGRVETVSSSPP